MDPRDKKKDVPPDELPALEEQDWEDVESGSIQPDSMPENGDFRFDEPSGELPGEDDDNAYQNSDEALPEDREEGTIRRSPDKSGTHFDEV